jgi:alpha-L-fucosidase
MNPPIPAAGTGAHVLALLLILPLCSGVVAAGGEKENRMKKIDEVAAAGPYQASWSSLEKHETPAWYQDAKFGIFIHWGVYSVPAFGNEWYPRNMYQQGSKEFQHHVETYGPHARFGYKDFIPRFKAEKYDPGRWARLFKEAGAKFVVPVAEHHDGFAMYDTALSEWCAAKLGPKRDLIGDLAAAVRKEGLIFGLSSHRAEHWWFFDGGTKFPSDVQDAQYAGLYGPAQPEKTEPDPAFLDDWLARTCELVDRYRPQVVWFDWWIEKPAFQPYLQRFGAYYYNRGAKWRRGVAINYKNQAFPARAAVLDIERGQLTGIRPLFWQTDTSVSKNSWGYVTGQDYKTAGEIVGDLVDIVSKNGALLLNIGPRADGTIPEPEERILREIGRWLGVNGEAIYGTRPWKSFGEGPTQVVGGAFNDTKRKPFTGQDIRFTVKGNTLYAIALAWPGERITIRSLSTTSPLTEGNVADVRLMGHEKRLTWSRDEKGLAVRMPAEKPCEHAYVLKITGLRLDRTLHSSMTLLAELADLHGSRVQVETQGGRQNIGFWFDPKDWVSWEVRFAEAGVYEVTAEIAAEIGETEFVVDVAEHRIPAMAPKTRSWADFRSVRVGRVEIKKPGRYVLAVQPRSVLTWKPMNLATVRLEKVQ